MDGCSVALPPVRGTLRGRVGRLGVVLAALVSHGWVGLHVQDASAQSSDQYVASTAAYTVRIGATTEAGFGTTETICVVPYGGGPDIACAAPNAQGVATFTFDEPAAIAACRFQAIARNAYGDSGLSAEWSQFKARKPGDCNGDCRITVSDIVCTNNAIFFGG